MTRASDTAKLLGAGATILDGTTISTADNDPQLILTSTDADGNEGPVLKLLRNSASPADDDNGGRVQFTGKNDAAQDVEYGRVRFNIQDATDGTEDGQMDIATMINGSLQNRIFINDTGIVFNDGSLDSDFRVESDGDANALFVQGSSGYTGIGTNSPSHALHVLTSTDGSGLSGSDTFVAKFHNAEATDHVNYGVKIQAGSSSNDLALFVTDHDESNTLFYLFGDGSVMLGGGAGFASGARRKQFEINTNTVALKSGSSDTGTQYHEEFHNPNGHVGSITTNGSSTSFATSSDYRLKENVIYDFDATTRLKQLKPCRFNFIADPNATVDGFIAHEVTAVPEAITGEKDAMTEEVLYVDGDEIPDGKKVGDVKEASKIAPQSIDQSKLVPLLTKTILELEARITTLENA